MCAQDRRGYINSFYEIKFDFFLAQTYRFPSFQFKNVFNIFWVKMMRQSAAKRQRSVGKTSEAHNKIDSRPISRDYSIIEELTGDNSWNHTKQQFSVTLYPVVCSKS